ncbi:MAG TPA: precorrin-3B C(17)-methyltransferase [Kutzneria sp.]|jgi:preprotein translocase subunit SecD
MDSAIGEPHIVPSTSNPAPITDAAQAARVRQAVQLADDPGAQQAAFAALDCAKPDPLKGKDDPALPLAACDSGGEELLLGPVLLDDRAIANASYFHDAEPDAWVINLSFTPAGRKLWADFTGAHEGDYVAMLVDGQVLSSPKINGRIDGDTEITGGFTEQTARDLAASINNH